MSAPPFELLARDPGSGARRGRIHTAHGPVDTPAFMPVGTRGAVRAMAPDRLRAAGVQMVLANTYHLHLRPGAELVAAAGGLHTFMRWPAPLLTDSGGYQVFSLNRLRRVDEDGVHFRSHIDGRPLFLGPRESMRIQGFLGADIAMVFDECTPYPCDRDYAAQSMRRSLRWAAACREAERPQGQLLFGIVQGGLYPELRAESAAALVAAGFDGYGIGGLSVGEPIDELYRGLEMSIAGLPADRPRYSMGSGTPLQIVESVARGADLFDCVLPTRLARNGSAYTAEGVVPIKAARCRASSEAIEPGCGCYACQTGFSRAYIRHLLNVNEILAFELLTLHNLHFYMQLMRRIRAAIEAGQFACLRREFAARYQDRTTRARAAGESPC